MVIAAKTFGDELRGWRDRRRRSQLDLATEAGVSQRHLSFLETGRSKPSREMVLHLAGVLEVPLREQNTLLTAAGFAPQYAERGLDDPDLDQVRHVLEVLLEAHDPFPAYVVDRTWNLVLANDAAVGFVSMLVDPSVMAELGGNVLRVSLHPEGLRSVVVNWDASAAAIVQRLTREVADRPGDEDLAQLLDEVTAYPGVDAIEALPSLPSGEDLLIPLHIRTDDLDLRFFTTIATIGAPFDITLEELRLETLLPADRPTEETLRELRAR